jgi:YbbR domain-containing protein
MAMRVRIFRNFGIKVLSIALAALLWGLVAGQREAERALRIPLEYRNIPEHLEMLGEPASLVDVRVRGSSGLLGELRAADLVAVLDLSAARAGKRLFHLLPDDINVPTGVSVLQVTPSVVSLTFEFSAVRTVPVVPDVEGEPAEGFVAGRVIADPAMVEVMGPQSAVQQVTEATTDPVSIAGARATVRDTVTIGLPDSAARLRHPRTGTVTVEIAPAPVDREIARVPVRLQGLDARRRATLGPQTVAVHVRGAAGAVAGLGPESLKLYADVSGLGRGRYNLPVRFEPNNDYTITRVEPATLDVVIR